MTMTSPVSFSRVPDGMPVAAAARRHAAALRLLRSPPAGGAGLARASEMPEMLEVEAGPPRAAAAQAHCSKQRQPARDCIGEPCASTAHLPGLTTSARQTR